MAAAIPAGPAPQTMTSASPVEGILREGSSKPPTRRPGVPGKIAGVGVDPGAAESHGAAETAPAPVSAERRKARRPWPEGDEAGGRGLMRGEGDSTPGGSGNTRRQAAGCTGPDQGSLDDLSRSHSGVGGACECLFQLALEEPLLFSSGHLFCAHDEDQAARAHGRVHSLTRGIALPGTACVFATAGRPTRARERGLGGYSPVLSPAAEGWHAGGCPAFHGCGE